MPAAAGSPAERRAWTSAMPSRPRRRNASSRSATSARTRAMIRSTRSRSALPATAATCGRPPRPRSRPPPRSIASTVSSSGVCPRQREHERAQQRALARLRRADDAEVPRGALEVQHERLGALLARDIDDADRGAQPGGGPRALPERGRRGDIAEREAGRQRLAPDLMDGARRGRRAAARRSCAGRRSQRWRPRARRRRAVGSARARRERHDDARRRRRAHRPRLGDERRAEALVDARVDLQEPEPGLGRQHVGVGRTDHAAALGRAERPQADAVAQVALEAAQPALVEALAREQQVDAEAAPTRPIATNRSM